jgi:S-adenosylmethionine:tRNA ribosyltransferase-isomerase
MPDHPTAPLRLSDFDYDLPPEFIAQSAVEPRDSSKLLVVHREAARRGADPFEHRLFRDVSDYLRPGDVLLLNQTRVIPARLHARKLPSGGVAEIFLLQALSPTRWLCLIGASRVRVGAQLRVTDPNGEPAAITATVVETQDEAKRVIEFTEPIEPHLDYLGEMPLPPYIHEKLSDPTRCQTVYARQSGSVAAPTVGLHAEEIEAILLKSIRSVRCRLTGYGSRWGEKRGRSRCRQQGRG